MKNDFVPKKEVIDWGFNYLIANGYSVKQNQPEYVKDSPWSYVVRFNTSAGYIYLKHTPNLLALEASITQTLRDEFQAPVPEIIAHHADLDCFLMKDAGIPLREILKKQFDVSLVIQAIEKFTSLQIDIEDHVVSLLDMGVPDYRLDKLPNLYMELLSNQDLLMEEGLSRQEIFQLKKLIPTVSKLSQALAGYAIKQTIVQPDFHDNNVLLTESLKQITLIDLGEIVISHPFFSLINCLFQLKKHHGLRENDVAFIQIKEACFKQYANRESKENLLKAFEIASRLEWVYGALANERLVQACDKESLKSLQQGKLGALLREFIKINDI